MTVYEEIAAERKRQDAKFGVQHHSAPLYAAILAEEAGEAAKAALHLIYEDGSMQDLRDELIQTAAVAVQIVEKIDEGDPALMGPALSLSAR